MMRALLAFCMLVFSALATAQGTAPGQYTWEEYGKRIKTSQAVAPLGPNLFGDQVSYSNGALSFSVTDVSLPGNNDLAVAFSRSYSVFNRKDYLSDRILADWDIEVPNLNSVFAPDWKSSGAAPLSRCSNFIGPPLPTPAFGFSVADYWQGINIDIPGMGSQELLATRATTTKPLSGAPYLWVTSGQIHVSCLSVIKNGTGEGFLAVTPDGTRYWFDWMAQYTETMMKKVKPADPNGAWPITEFAYRKKNLLYATRVEDRFGNTVEYTYTNNWNAPAKLTKISSSDGRQLSISYSGGYVSSVSDGTRTWSYAYAGTTSGRNTLTTVTRPDASTWNINFSGLTNGEIKYHDVSLGEVYRTCTQAEIPVNYDEEPVGTVTHPSGAVGTFKVAILRHGRSSVPVNCSGYTSGPGAENNTNDDVSLYATSSYSFSLIQKGISGLGVTPAQWNYSYDPNISVYRYPGTTMDYPLCVLGDVACMAPPCPPSTCVGGSSKTTVTGPSGEWTRYSYGNTYLNNEGKLLKVETGSGGTVLKTVESAYDLTLADQVYPARYGDSLRMYRDGFESEYHRPLLSTKTTQQATDFISTNQTFDYFAQPLKVRRESSLGQNKIESYTYENNLLKWVIGQVKTVVCTSSSLPGCSGQTVAQVTYDPVTANQLTFTSFGQLKQTLTYNTDGTVATVKDGNNNITTLSSWKRGIPQKIKYPATPEYPTGAEQTAEVHDAGWINWVEDENRGGGANGYRTCYAHDAMGRVSKITYPSETVAGVCNTSKWAETTIAFTPGHPAAYGMPAGHWRQTTLTGNGRKILILDALWRPVAEQTLDLGDVNNTTSEIIKRYDTSGRLAFESYPMRTLGTANYADPTLKGTHFTYDALDRATQTRQDWEGVGQLTTTTEYLTGFKTRITNPRSQQTTTGYMVWDQPAYDWPAAIVHPEGTYTDIARDVFGKPTSIKRRNNAGSVSLTRSLTYGGADNLCTVTEPETNTTVVWYDVAGNLIRSAGGLIIPAGTSCVDAKALALASARTVVRTYDARHRIKTLTFADGKGNQTWTYTPDGLPASVVTQNVGAPLVVTNSYAYNRRRLMTSETQAMTGWGNFYLNRDYNANGHLSQATFPPGYNGPVVDYAPNALGQPTKAGIFANTVSYYPNGALKQFTYGNGIVHTLTQNARGLPDTSCDFYGSCNASAVLNDGYDYDQNSNVQAISDGRTGNPGNRNMTYDGLDRLTAATSPMFGTATYAYDVLDNLTRVKLTGGIKVRDHTYVYDASNRLTNVTNTVGGASVIGLGYDMQGNLHNKSGQAYKFDLGNRLREVPTKEDGFYYDAHGRRVLSTRYVGGTSGLRSAYSVDGQLLFQQDQGLGIRKDFIYLGSNLIAERSRPFNAAGTPVTLKYQHTDALGSPVAITNEARTVVERTNYEPYGSPANRTARNGVGYTGHVEDAATELVYMQQRYFDPVIGRFLSVDPINADGNTGAKFNRYMYALNNPYKFTDPDGRDDNSIYGDPSRMMSLPADITPDQAMAAINLQVAVLTGSVWNAVRAFMAPVIRTAVDNAGSNTASATASGSLKNRSGSIDDSANAARSNPHPREVSGHANQRLQTRDNAVTPESMETAAVSGQRTLDPATGLTVHNLPASASPTGRGVTVVTTPGGRVVTVIDKGSKFEPQPQPPPQQKVP